jgi:hypothetical protein
MRRPSPHVTVFAFAALLAAGCAGAPSVLTQDPAAVAPMRAAPMKPLVSIEDAPFTQLNEGRWHPQASATCPASLGTRDGDAGSGVNRNASTDGTLFVADFGPNHIEEYDAAGTNQNALGSLAYTNFDNPYGISVDQNGTLYVASYNNQEAMVFPQGASAPTLTIGFPIIFPLDVAADNSGDVYVVDDRGGPILIFPPGASSNPQQLTGFMYPTDIAFDAAGDLFIVDHLWGKKKPLGAVFEIPVGSQTQKNLNLTKLDFPVGVAIDSSNDLAITNLGNNTVTEYAPGTTKPKRTIGALKGGICTPVYDAFNAAGDLYVVNNQGNPNGNVTGYLPGKFTPFVTLTHTMANPRGIAVNPNWQPSK